MIRIYQRTISPYLPDQCRFEPTCSHYAVEAFRKRGFWAGSLLTFKKNVYREVLKEFRQMITDFNPDEV